MMMTRYVVDAAERAEFVQAWEASGVTCVFQNAGEEGQSPQRLLKRLAYFTYATDRMADFMPKAVAPDDMRAIVDTGGLVGICAIPPYLGGTGDIAALLDHVDHVAKRFGVEPRQASERKATNKGEK